VGVGLEEREEEVALSSPDIDHPGKRGEVIGGHNGRGRLPVPIGHGIVEHRGGLGMVRPVVIDAHAEDMLKRGLARVHTVEHPRPHAVILFTRLDRPGPQRAGHAGPQTGAHRRQPEARGLVFDEHADSGKGPQHPIERAGIGARGLREHCAALGAVPQQVGNAELGDSVDRPRDPVARDQA
jgi:hypothetical protein